mgnify:CR=1 FL=1
MLQIQLYIEGQEVELYKDESVSLTQSIQDVRDIKKIFTDYTRTFSVPASKNNNKIFKHFYNYFIEGFDARTKKDAELHLNYKPFKKGKIKLEGVSLNNNEAKTYRVTFFGSTVVLPDLLGEDRIANLTELSAFDFRYNDSNIQSYMTNGLDNNIGDTNIDDAILFPLITHTNRLTYDSAVNELYNLDTTGADNGVPFTELKPALRIHAIIKAIELHYGLSFSDDFFNSDNEAYYNLYMWLHTKAGGLFVDQDKAQQFSRYQFIEGVAKSINELVVRSNNFRINNADAKIEFRLRFQVTPALSNVEHNVVITRNGQEFKRFDGLTGETKNGIQASDYDTVDDAIVVDNGEFSVFIETENATSFDLNIIVVKENTRFLGGKKDDTIKASLETFTDTNIAITTQLPDMKIIDFLTGLFKMFNLTAYRKDNGTIVVQTLDDYYASSTTTHNITEFVVTDQSQIDSPIPYKQVNMGYEGTSTFLATNFKRISNKDWGRLEFNSQAKFEGSIYSLELPFEHLLYERLNDADTGDITNIQWGWYVDEKQEASSEQPLLFYPVKATSGSIAARTIANTKVTITTPYMPSNTESLMTSSSIDDVGQSINFHAERDEYGLPNGDRITNEKTLFKTYYEDYIKDLFDVRKRITKISAYLPLRITETLNLADNIKIFDKIYRINTITTNFETNKSELVLTNIIQTAKIEGTTPVVEVAKPLATIDEATNVDIASDEITADSTLFTADRTQTSTDGFDLPDIIEPVSSEVVGNELPPQQGVLCEVTPPTINRGGHESLSTSIRFDFIIEDSGTICDVDNIDEFGFLIASQESYLAGNDIDVIKAEANVTTVATVRGLDRPSLQVGIKQTTITGLTHPATRYARFYAKTSNDPDYASAFVISDVISATTDTGDTQETQFLVSGAGSGDTTGYSTIPTLAEIDAKANVASGAGKCYQEIRMTEFYHNGNGRLPILGDKVKYYINGDYTGGASSSGAIGGASSGVGKYYALAIAESTGGTAPFYSTVKKYIVVEWSTAEVVAVYECPNPLAENPFFYRDAGYGIAGFTDIPTSFNEILGGLFYKYTAPPVCGLSHIFSLYQGIFNGTGTFPVVGDNVAYSSRYNYNGGADSWPSSYQDDIYRYIAFAIVDESLPRTVSNFIGFIVVDSLTSKVVARFDCP